MIKELNLIDVLSDSEKHRTIKNEILNEILNDFSKRKRKVKIYIGDHCIERTLGNVLTNIVLLEYFVGRTEIIKEDPVKFEELFIIEQDFYAKMLSNYVNNVIKILRKHKVSFDEIRKITSNILNELADMSGEFNVLFGNSICYLDFVKHAAENPEVYDLFNPQIDSTMRFDEVEDLLHQKGKEIAEYFRNQPETDLYYYLHSGTGINIQQMTQTLFMVGLRPDMDGSVIPYIIKENYLVGLKELESYYIDCKGTRKALATNFMNVRESGYLSRKLMLANVDNYHDNNLETCNTKHFIRFFVKDKETLNRIKGRHFHKIDQLNFHKLSDKVYNVDDFGTDLIGQWIGLRSPITCASDKVCRTCYGKELSELNKNINTGLLAVLYLTEPLTQKLLSSKHLLSTNTDKINWGKKFMKYFDINLDSIIIKDPKIVVEIDKDDIDKDEDGRKYVNKLKILNDKNGEILLEYKTDIDLYIDQDAYASAVEDDLTLTFNNKKEDPENILFTFEVKNNELTSSLNRILDLIEKNDHLGVDNYHDLVKVFLELLIENELDLDSVHAEMISRVLIRDIKDETRRPDFTKDEITKDDYVINRVSQTIMNGPLSVSLAFERIKAQLVDINTYMKRDESMLDYIFQ